jgi:hypothetical protein
MNKPKLLVTIALSGCLLLLAAGFGVSAPQLPVSDSQSVALAT